MKTPLITFVVQNETHALNFMLIIEKMIEFGFDRNRIDVLCLDPVSGLSTKSLIQFSKKRSLDLEIIKPFYLLNSIQRLAWMFKSGNPIKESVANTHILLVGNDGAIQRRMSQTVKEKGGIVMLLHDGLLFPWPKGGVGRLKYIIKRIFLRIAGRYHLDHYCPSDVGHSRLDLIYVMHENVKEILRDQGVRSNVKVVTLPRFENFLYQFSALQKDTKRKLNNYLYVTGAYEWHGSLEGNNAQQRDLKDIRKFAENNPSLYFRIRIHPREELSEYSSLEWPENVSISSGRPVAEDLAWASVLITARSTMALEAKLVGVPVMIYTANFSPPPPESVLGSDPYFMHFNRLSKLPEVAESATSNMIHENVNSTEEIAKDLICRFKEYAACSLDNSEL